MSNILLSPAAMRFTALAPVVFAQRERRHGL
jgi:hypothetical protein